MTTVLYGHPGRTADLVAAEIARKRGIARDDVDRLVQVAGAHERPKLVTLADLAEARPPVAYYAFRLLAEHGQQRLPLDAAS